MITMVLRELSYDANLTLEQAEQRFQEALEEFNKIKTNYTGGFLNYREYKFLMSKRNRNRLAAITDVLLPLSLQPSVQEQIGQVPSEQTVHYKSQLLNSYALDMSASFLNTGVKRIGYSEPLWRRELTFS